MLTGFRFTEGPVWHPVERHLTFSDIPASIVHRWFPDGKLTALRNPSGMANGNAYDSNGRLVTCEHLTSRVVRQETDGSLSVLADRWQGRELNSPNDVAAARDGSLYFSDPPYGRRFKAFGGLRPVPQVVNGAYRIGADGVLDRVADDFDTPNGLCLSPDQRRLFIADSARRHIRVLDLSAAGQMSIGKLWADVPSEGMAVPDGLKCDSAGNVYCSGKGGVHVFGPAGVHLGHIPVPELVANFTFGGNDLKTLFVAASRSIYATRMKVAGQPAF